MLDAVQNGDIITLRWLFDRGFPIDHSLNQNGDTALLLACRLGQLDVARLALLYNARNDPHPQFGQTAIQQAVSSGHSHIVKLILSAAPSGLDEVIVNHTDENGEAPIHVASRCGSIKILNLLIMHGANVGVVDARGRTCLHLASQQGHVSCLLCLLEVGGDEFMEVRDDEGWKCLDLAIRAGQLECVRVLCQTGANVSAKTIALASKRPKMFKLVMEYTADSDGSISTDEDESRSSSIGSQGGTIFSGLDTFIASPELRQFRTPMSTEDDIDREDEEEMNLDFCHDGETWAIYFTDDGYRYFYNTDRDYSSWDDPRSKRLLFEQQTQSSKKRLPASPNVQFHRSPVPVRSFEPTASFKSIPEKEAPLEEPEVTDSPEATAIDPKSILLAQITSRHDKTTSSINELLANNDEHPNKPIPKKEDLLVKPKESEVINTVKAARSDPKSLLLAQIRSRHEKHISSSSINEPSTNNNDEHPIKPSPKEEHQRVKSKTPEVINPLKAAGSDPKSLLLAQIRSRHDKNASSELSANDTHPNKVRPEKERSPVQPTDPKSILLAQIQIKPRECKPAADKNLDNSKQFSESKPSVESSADSNDALQKYLKMKTVGVPLAAILQRMSRDGVSQSMIQLFQQQQKTTGDEPTPPHQPQISSATTIQSNEVLVATSPAKSPTQQKEDLLKDKSMAKYVQMTKVGVPPAAVTMKMSQDGIEDKKINSFRVAFGLNSSEKKTPKQRPPPPHRRSSKAMQKVHWRTIEEEKLRNSLWTLSSQIDAEISEKEVQELETLFSASPRPSAKAAIGLKRGRGARATKQISASFIEPKRANNVSISLAQYRAFSNFDDLVTAVASLDETNLNAEKVNNMTTLLPTTSELNQLQQLNGQVEGLGRAELFFISVAKMKCFKEKLHSFCYLLQFDEQMKILNTNLITLEAACTEVISSKNLAFVCKKLLNIGNIMNQESATGITLNSLIKIAKKKGRDGKSSVIDHLISTVDNCDAMSFKHDVPTLRDCIRLDLDEMKFSFSEIESGLNSIDSTIEAEQSLVASTDENERPEHSVNFLSRITPFQQRAADELKAMKDLIVRVTSKVEELKRFFAEEPSSTSTSIFEQLLEFSSIVETSKDAYHRKQRALRRRDSMQRPRVANM